MNKRLAFLIVPSLFLLSIVAGVARVMGIEPGFPSSPVAQERTARDSGPMLTLPNAPHNAASPSKRMAAKSAPTTQSDAFPPNTPRWQ